MARHFTLSQAQAVLPEVDRLLQEALALKNQYQEVDTALEALAQKVMLQGGVVIDRDRVLSDRKRRDQLAEKLKNTLDAIQEFGCLVKDLDTGLLDFPTYLRGEEVYLCWKLGESGISYWHGVSDGFAGRKRIDQDFLDHHQGDPAN